MVPVLTWRRGSGFRRRRPTWVSLEAAGFALRDFLALVSLSVSLRHGVTATPLRRCLSVSLRLARRLVGLSLSFLFFFFFFFLWFLLSPFGFGLLRAEIFFLVVD